METKDYASAKAYLERALPFARTGAQPEVLPDLLVNLAEAALATNAPDPARQYLDEAMGIARRTDDQRSVANVHRVLAAADRRAGRLTEARAHIREAEAVAATLHNQDLTSAVYAEAVQTAEAAGDYRQALDYTRKFVAADEAVRGEKARLKVAELQTRYEAESRAREIKLLQAESSLQRSELARGSAQLSQAHSQRLALVALVVCVATLLGALAGRLRRRVRAAQHLLNESEERFRSAFEYSALGMALVNPEGRWLKVNQAVCRIVGYAEADLLATTHQAITYPDDLPGDAALISQTLRGERDSFGLEKRYLHRDGHTVWVRVDVSLLRHPVSREGLYFITQIQDITESKQAKEALRAAKEEAERANTAKSEFLSRVSHELRTPLNAILGFGQLLEMDDLSTRQEESVGHIMKGGRHLLALVNDVLDLTGIERGKTGLNLEDFAVGPLLRETAALVGPLAQERGVRVHLDLATAAAAAGSIHADRRRVKQVLLNLLSNAVKYNRAVDGEVFCDACVGSSASGEAPPASHLRLRVRDTGAGIGAAEQRRLFTPFERLGAADGPIKGTGLGLAVSKQLVEAMGGRIGVESAPGQGSTFWVDLPTAG